MTVITDALKDYVVRKGWKPGTHLENQVARYLSLAGQRCEQQYRVGRYRIDFAWPDRKIALEADGWWHRSPEGATRDRTRDSWMRSQGWVVFRVDDEHGEDSLREQVNRVIGLVIGSRPATCHHKPADVHAGFISLGDRLAERMGERI